MTEFLGWQKDQNLMMDTSWSYENYWLQVKIRQSNHEFFLCSTNIPHGLSAYKIIESLDVEA